MFVLETCVSEVTHNWDSVHKNGHPICRISRGDFLIVFLTVSANQEKSPAGPPSDLSERSISQDVVKIHFIYISAESFENRLVLWWILHLVTAYHVSKGLNGTLPWQVSLVYFNMQHIPNQEGFRKITVLCSKLTLLPSFNPKHILKKMVKRKGRVLRVCSTPEMKQSNTSIIFLANLGCGRL